MERRCGIILWLIGIYTGVFNGYWFLRGRILLERMEYEDKTATFWLG